MDPISIGIGVIGLGMSLFGSSSAASEAKHQAELSRQRGEQQQLINDQNYQAAQLQYRRSNLEIMRNAQRARSLALNAAVNQGAQFGSGLSGGYGQISGQSNTNQLSNDQAYYTGENVYGINRNITGLNAQITDSQSAQASAQGMASLGGSLMGSASTIGRLSKGFGGGFSDPLSGFGGSSRWGFGG